MCQLESVCEHTSTLLFCLQWFFWVFFFLENRDIEIFSDTVSERISRVFLKGDRHTVAVQKLPLRLPGIIWLTGLEESS